MFGNLAAWFLIFEFAQLFSLKTQLSFYMPQPPIFYARFFSLLEICLKKIHVENRCCDEFYLWSLRKYIESFIFVFILDIWNPKKCIFLYLLVLDALWKDIFFPTALYKNFFYRSKFVFIAQVSVLNIQYTFHYLLLNVQYHTIFYNQCLFENLILSNVSKYL